MDRDTLLKFVESLAKKETNTIGFVPRSNYEAALQRDRLAITWANNEPTGFCFWGLGRAQRKGLISIYQIAVPKDIRRMYYATELLQQIANHEDARHTNGIILACRAELAATQLWQSLGFRIVDTRNEQNARKHPVHVWRLDLTKATADSNLRILLPSTWTPAMVKIETTRLGRTLTKPFRPEGIEVYPSLPGQREFPWQK